MNPFQLIGMPFRLGADPVKHGKTDCLSLARTVLKHYGIDSPEPTRDWYRRLRKKDYAIFKQELQKWGTRTKTPNIGTVGLAKSKQAYCLVVFFEQGWLSCNETEVRWSPLDFLPVEELYCPSN